MALNSTMYVFTVRLADVDRAVYERLVLRVAQHPSETPEYLIARVLAYCLEYAEGIAFSKGLSDPEEPAILVRDLDRRAPDVDRSRAGSSAPTQSRKAARRVVAYAHRDVEPCWHASPASAFTVLRG